MNGLESSNINDICSIIDLEIKNTSLIEKLQQSNFSLTKNVINLTNDIIYFSTNCDKLNTKFRNVFDEKNQLLKDKHKLLIENNIFKTKLHNLESELNIKKYEMYSKDINLKALKDAFETNNQSKNILIQKYIENTKKSDHLIFELKNNVDKFKNQLEENEKKITCAICYKNKINVLLEPCCHLCMCDTCLSELTTYSRFCPICRQTFTDSKRVYF